MSEPTIEVEADPNAVTGNLVRDAMLRSAIQAYGTDLDALAAALPDDFKTDAKEVAAMAVAMGIEPVQVESKPEPDAPEGEPQLSITEAKQALAEWQHKTQLARTALRDADIACRQSRSELVSALNFFLIGGPQTPEQMKREYIASEQARKAQGAERHRPLTTHGPSVVDIGRAGQSSVNRNYAPKRRPDMMSGRRTYGIADSTARSGSGIIDTPGIVAVPRVSNE